MQSTGSRPSPTDHEFFKNEEFQVTMNDFSETRKKKRAPLTEGALRLILRKLVELSGNDVATAVKILEQSIENGWQGVFAIRVEQDFSKPGNTSTPQREI